MLVGLADAEQVGGGGAHPHLLCGAVKGEPVLAQALQTSNFVSHLVVENLGAAAGDGVESGIAQAENRVAEAETAVLGDGQDLGCGGAVEVNLGKALPDARQHFLVPVNLEVGMQAAL